MKNGVQLFQEERIDQVVLQLFERGRIKSLDQLEGMWYRGYWEEGGGKNMKDFRYF